METWILEKTPAFRLREWTVHPALLTLENPNTTIQLEPKLMKVLLVLCRKPGEVVAPQELINAVWSQTHISESLVRRAVSELRRHLGDDAKNPSYIQTIAKTGYRVIAPIQPVKPLILQEKSPPASKSDFRFSANAKRIRALKWLALWVGVLAGGWWLSDALREQGPGFSRTANPVGTENRGWFQDLEAGPDGKWVAFS